jgi:hypothetical protein
MKIESKLTATGRETSPHPGLLATAARTDRKRFGILLAAPTLVILKKGGPLEDLAVAEETPACGAGTCLGNPQIIPGNCEVRKNSCDCGKVSALPKVNKAFHPCVLPSSGANARARACFGRACLASAPISMCQLPPVKLDLAQFADLMFED